MAKDSLTLAWNDMRCRNFATAIKRLETKSEIYQENFEYYLALGIACLYLGDMGASFSYLQMARRIKLTDSRLLLAQAAIFLRRGDTARALQYYLEIIENDPNNKTARAAMEFIRLHGDYDTICRWADTGKLELFYPPLGVNPNKILKIVLPALAALLGVGIALAVFPKGGVAKGGRMDLSSLELTAEERADGKESDLSTQSYQYVFSSKDINKHYTDAMNYFQKRRDNAARVEVNILLNSNASLSIKKKARMLAGYFEVPDFNTITDVPTYSEVVDNKSIYLDCWVDWGGKVSNAQIYDNGSYSCDLLVGNENLSKYEGTVHVVFDQEPSLDLSSPVKILGRIALEDNQVLLKGRALYQSIHK